MFARVRGHSRPRSGELERTRTRSHGHTRVPTHGGGRAGGRTRACARGRLVRGQRLGLVSVSAGTALTLRRGRSSGLDRSLRSLFRGRLAHSARWGARRATRRGGPGGSGHPGSDGGGQRRGAAQSWLPLPSLPVSSVSRWWCWTAARGPAGLPAPRLCGSATRVQSPVWLGVRAGDQPADARSVAVCSGWAPVVCGGSSARRSPQGGPRQPTCQITAVEVPSPW